MPDATKTELRRRLMAARRAEPSQRHDDDAEALIDHLADVVGDAETVCAYVPVGAEPGSPALLDELVRLGVKVLLPAVAAEGAPLDWGRYTRGGLVTARWGLQEPRSPRLGRDAIGAASTIIIPALAVDRYGVRLGRGAGFYDRSLPLASPGARVVAVVRDDEVLDELPSEPHDIPATHVLTPRAGLVQLDPG